MDTKILNLPDIVGVAPNAFSRVVPSSFLKNYHILCFKYRGETTHTFTGNDVYCLQYKHPDIEIAKLNTKNILDLEESKKYLKGFDDFWLLIYSPKREIEELAYKNGWRIIANPALVVGAAFRVLGVIVAPDD